MIFLEKRINRYFISILSGVIMFISFPFTGSQTYLAFIAWIPLLFLTEHLIHAESKSRHLFLHSYIVFFIYNLGSTWWIWNASSGGMIFAVVLNALLMALFIQIYFLLKKHTRSNFGLLLFLVSWISFEYYHYTWELSWPWLSIGNVFSIHPEYIQWYEFTGVLGGTAWVLTINYLLFNLIKSTKTENIKHIFKSKLAILIFFIINGPILYSLYRYHQYNETKDAVEVVLIQPNINPYTEKFSIDVATQVEKVTNLAKPLITPKTKIIIAPETAISASFWEHSFQQTYISQYIQQFVSSPPSPLFLCGASTLKYYQEKNSTVSRAIPHEDGFYESYNTSVLFQEKRDASFIHKSKLVLGVERIPFNTLLPWLEDLAIDFDGASGSLGIEKTPKIFKTKELNFTSSVCYESVYGEFIGQQVKEGAQVVFIITNDGWWGDTPGYKQHASFARLRAIENRRSIGRSANTGVSCFINQRGDVISKTNWDEEIAVKQTINKNKKLTFYSRYGDWIGMLASFLFFVSCVFVVLLKIKRAIKKKS